MKLRPAVCILLFFLAAVLFTSPASAQAAPEKQKIICDHAAPPRGMHRVCKSQCDCHLEGKLKIDEGGVAPVDSNTEKPIGRCDRSAIYIAVPDYPSNFLAHGITGKVSVLVVTDSDGNVVKARALGGHPMVWQPAVESVRKWRFDPACGETHQIEFTYRFRRDVADQTGAYIHGDSVEIIANPSNDEDFKPKSKKKKLNPTN